MFQKIYFQAEQAKNLENCKGKKVIVHAVRPNIHAAGFQKFMYEGVIDKGQKEQISIASGGFYLDVGNILFFCKFIVSERANPNECFVMSIEDPETHKTIYENGTSLKFDGEEMLGSGIITGLEDDRYLGQFNNKPAILLNTFNRDDHDYIELKVSNNLTFIGQKPENFQLKSIDAKNVETEEETL